MTEGLVEMAWDPITRIVGVGFAEAVRGALLQTVRSFDPCLPCGVHMYMGGGRVIHTEHAPMGAAVPAGGTRS